MKILVTGGAGFIGSNLVLRLMSDDRITAVRVLDNLETGRFANISAFKDHHKFEFHPEDPSPVSGRGLTRMDIPWLDRSAIEQPRAPRHPELHAQP